MNAASTLFLAVLLLSSFVAKEVEAAPAELNGGLPAMIREKEKGVFYLRVLNKGGQEISSGTGFLVDRNGTLVTALHVILPKREVAGSVEALSADGKTWKVEGVSASDSSVDLAVLKLAKVPDGGRPLDLAGDGLPVQGAKVLVLGHPQGFQFVATDGIVSATHKTDHLPEPLRQSGFIHSAPDVVWIQTTAAVSNGNSGGPLLDESGDVIGIVQWMARGQGMNFALQVASIRKLLDQPTQLQTLQAFTEPEADFFALMKEPQIDSMRFREENFFPFGMPEMENVTPRRARNPSQKYVPALLALAIKHRGKDVELPILMQLMNLAAGEDCPPKVAADVKKAADRLVEKFRDDRRLLSFLRSPSTPRSPEAKEFVSALSKASSDVEIRALAALMSARGIDLNGNDGEPLKAAMDFAREAAKCPPGIMLGQKSVAEAAGKLIAMLEHSSVGCQAPELTGIDQDGKPVKLSDLKGRHVVVAFYTTENEFITGVSGQLNDLVKYGKGMPFSVIGVLVEEPGRFFSGSGHREVKKTWNSLKDDADGSLRKSWYISDAPTVFLIAPKGIIAGRFTDPPHKADVGFGALFGGGLFSPGAGASQWNKDLMEALKGIPELETEADKLAKLPNRLSASPIDPSLLKGLALRYSFDKHEVGTIRDSSGKEHHAKATDGEWANDPKTGGCYKLSKPGDQIESLDYKGVTGANPRTAMFWFKNVDSSIRPFATLLKWGRGALGENFELLLENGKGFVVDVCGGQQFSRQVERELLGGEWHHLAVTVSGEGMFKDISTFIDGKPVTTSPYTPGKRAPGFFRTKPLNTTAALPVTIGSERVSGFVDEVMIWERALDGVEIARLYKATGGQKLDPALESAILVSNKLSQKREPAAEKPLAAADNDPMAGELEFSEWLTTVRFRSDNGIQLFIEGDRMRLSGIKGFNFQIDEKSRTVTWQNSRKRASVTVSPDRKSGVWTKPDGVKHPLIVIQVKPAIEKTDAGNPTKELATMPVPKHNENDPSTATSALRNGALQAWSGMDADYTATSRTMLAWAADTKNPDVAERVAKLACLQPIGDVKMRDAALVLAQKALELEPKSPWHQMTLGMAEYRNGHFKKAEEVLRAIPGSIDRNTYKPELIQGTADFYRTMSLFKQGESVNARVIFTATEAKMKPFPAAEKNPLSDKADHDDLVLWLACREAREMLGLTAKPGK